MKTKFVQSTLFTSSTAVVSAEEVAEVEVEDEVEAVDLELVAIATSSAPQSRSQVVLTKVTWV